MAAKHGAHAHHREPQEAGAGHTDPVCGMAVEPSEATPRHSYQGQTYHFCSRRCAERFAEDPDRFVGDDNEDRHETQGEDARESDPLHGAAPAACTST